MSVLPLDPDTLLTTTRAVRRRLDFERPLDLGLVRECLEIALQAPSGSNSQGWHFVLVTEPAKRRRIGEIYRECFAIYREQSHSAHALAARAEGAERVVMEEVVRSAEHLAEHMGRAPALLIPCIRGRLEGVPPENVSRAAAGLMGSILPAVWSFMLAARARGLGTAWTSLHLMREKEVGALLGIPVDGIMQVMLTPIAYTLGTEFKPAKRRPLDTVLHVNAW
jgi:nitroreductase